MHFWVAPAKANKQPIAFAGLWAAATMSTRAPQRDWTLARAVCTGRKTSSASLWAWVAAVSGEHMWARAASRCPLSFRHLGACVLLVSLSVSLWRADDCIPHCIDSTATFLGGRKGRTADGFDHRPHTKTLSVWHFFVDHHHPNTL